MSEPHVSEIVRIIQLVVAPVFFLTAIGTLINALNTRLARAVDRRRALEQGAPQMRPEESDAAREELAQIARRIRLGYLAILFAVLSGLFICLLIAGAFLGALVDKELTRTIAALFVLAVLALVVSLLLFLREIFLAVTTPRHRPL